MEMDLISSETRTVSRRRPSYCDPLPIEVLAYRYGRTYDSYLVTEPGWQSFPSKDRQGMVAFVRQGRHLFVSGGLLAPDDHKERLLSQLVRWTEAECLGVTFLNIPEEELPLFRDLGFQATKWGEEALIDLPACDWSGHAYEWVRRQTNFCRRSGLVVTEYTRAEMTPDDGDSAASELAEVSAQFLADKPQSREIRFLQATFDPLALGRKRVFVARSQGGTGRIEGFLACNPFRDGAGWAMETYRQRPDAVRGTVPFLLHQATEILKGEGAETVSLCLIPGLGCEPMPGDSPLVRRAMVLGTRRFSFIFDTAGTYHFKTRFRPRFEGRYLCARPRFALGTAWAFLRLLGVLKLDLRKLGRRAVARWRKRCARASLQTPDVSS